MGQCPTRRSGGRFRGRLKKGLQTALEAEVAQEIEALLGREALTELDLAALELALRQRTLRLATHAIERLLHADLSDEASARLRCPGGRKRATSHAGPRTSQACWAPMRLERAYYHCSGCGRGFHPRDQHMGIEIPCRDSPGRYPFHFGHRCARRAILRESWEGHSRQHLAPFWVYP
jgi:hypothetical protein